MAVEMMMLKLQRHAERKGYTNAVDWWSLGVTMFVLLTGCKPFPTLNSSTVAALAVHLEEPAFKNGTKVLMETMTNKEMLPPQYLYVYQKLMRCQVLPNTVNIILQLLDCNEITRLGSKKAGGIAALKEHPFFKWSFVPSEGNATVGGGLVMMQPKTNTELPGGDDDSDFDMFENSAPKSTDEATMPIVNQPEPVAEYCWDLFELKNIVPPFMPQAPEINEHVAYNNFDEMMVEIDKVSWLKQYPSTYYDEYFQNW